MQPHLVTAHKDKRDLALSILTEIKSRRYAGGSEMGSLVIYLGCRVCYDTVYRYCISAQTGRILSANSGRVILPSSNKESVKTRI